MRFSRPQLCCQRSAQVRRAVARLLLAFTFIAASAQDAIARNLYSYDLDSLVFTSQEIVRGRIARRDDAGSVEAHQFVITASYLGSLKPEETVRLAALDFFHKPRDNRRERRKQVAVGDEIIAFLVRGKSAFAFEIPPDVVVFVPVPSGLKVISDNKACGFAQHDNPGPYVMEPPAGAPTVDEFEKQCAAAIARVRPIADRMSAATRADAPWLLGVLRERAATIGEPSHNDRDAIAERACALLAELKDLPSLDEALRHVNSSYAAFALHRGFASCEGREFLLQKLSHPIPPADAGRRRIYGRALEAAVWDYDRSAPADEKFLQRLAKLAVAFIEQGDEPTARILLSHLRTAADLHEQARSQSAGLPTALEPDLRTALKMLTEAYPQVKSPRLRFAMDVVLLTSEPQLGLTSTVGPVATILSIPGPERNYAQEPGHLIFEIDYASGRRAVGRQFAIELVVEGITTRRSFTVPGRIEIRGGSSGAFSQAVPLPADLPRGRYRLFCRLREGGEPVGDGHGVEAGLPASGS